MHTILLLSLLAILGWSAIAPHDYLTWAMEIAPVAIALPVLLLTYKRFTLTPLVYTLIWAHCVILIVGGHYTYAEVPLGEWAKEAFGFARNHYDQLGHLMQGFVPAILAREVYLRRSPLGPGAWLRLAVTSVCLAFSALYELIEWAAALLSAEASAAFLGTQGDVWDTQWDMFLALCGALLAQALLSRLHDRQLARLGGR